MRPAPAPRDDHRPRCQSSVQSLPSASHLIIILSRASRTTGGGSVPTTSCDFVSWPLGIRLFFISQKGFVGRRSGLLRSPFLQLLGQLDAEPSPIQGSFKKPCFLHPHTRHTTERRAASQVCPPGFVFSSPHPPTLAPYLNASEVGIFIQSDSFRQRPDACLSPATLHRRSQGTPSAAAGDAIRSLTPFLLLTGLLVLWSRSKAALKNGPTYRALWPGARPPLRPGMMLHGAPHKHKRMISHVFRIPSSGSEPLRSG